MRPSAAEVVRTLVRGRLPGVVRLDADACAVPIHHATAESGAPLLLVRDRSALADRLDRDPVVALTVRDRPPVPGAPRLGRAKVSGWVRRVDDAEARAYALTFAEANPVGALLDVGRTASLYALDVAEVQLFDRSGTVEVEPAAYTAAEPDPLHEYERELLLDLNDHHVPQIRAYFHRVLAGAEIDAGPEIRAVRLDRYGFLVDLDRRTDAGRRFARVDFPAPVNCRHELARFLQPVLFGFTR